MNAGASLSCLTLFLKGFIYLFLEREEEREKEREREKHGHSREASAGHLSRDPQLGTWPTTQACALTLTRN